MRTLDSLDVDFGFAVGANLGCGSRIFLLGLLAKTLGNIVDNLDDGKDNESHNEEVDDGCDELAVVDCCFTDLDRKR